MNTTATLGDVGPHDDQSYTGEVSTSPVSMDYFRAKFLEFQQAMNAGDRAYQAGVAVYFATDPDSQEYAELYALLIDYESRASEYKGIAESLNLGANVVNSLGGRLPVLSIPQSLGALPALVLPAGVLLALSAAVGAISYMVGFTAGMESTLRKIEAMPDNATKPEIVAAVREAVEARKQITLNPLSGIGATLGGVAGLVKVAVVGFLGYMAWKSFNDFADR